MKKQFLLFMFGMLLTSQPSLAQRIVVLTPDTADVVAQLGAANEVVGIHDYNHHPAYQGKSTIGFYRNLSPEPIAAQKPDLIVGSYMALPPNTYTRLQQSGLKVVNVNPKENLDDYIAGIKKLGQLLHKTKQADQLATAFQAGMKPLAQTGKRYLLTYDGRYVAGRNTVGDTLIRLAGGINAAASVDGIKPFSREAWLAAQPDVVVVAKHHERTIGGIQAMSNRPELASSPAVKNHKIVFWPADDFLRFGLNSPQIVKRLHHLAQ